MSKAWKAVTEMISSSNGTNTQGFPEIAVKPSSSRNRLPHEGRGSETPRPSTPKFASAKIKTGTEIQNCARRRGRRFGAKCRKSRRTSEHPCAHACNAKSEFRNDFAPAQTTRAPAAQPKQPRIKNVMVTDCRGGTFKGSKARTARSKNSQGRERTRSAADIKPRSVHPPKDPATPPTTPATAAAK